MLLIFISPKENFYSSPNHSFRRTVKRSSFKIFGYSIHNVKCTHKANNWNPYFYMHLSSITTLSIILVIGKSWNSKLNFFQKKLSRIFLFANRWEMIWNDTRPKNLKKKTIKTKDPPLYLLEEKNSNFFINRIVKKHAQSGYHIRCWYEFGTTELCLANSIAFKQ